MTTTGHNIVVVGTSAGGLDALDQLVGRLPTDLAAAIFVVQHLSPETSGAPLIRRLGRHKAFQAKLAKEGERFKRGRIYVAPPDNHLFIKSDRMLVRKGARENRNRPGIDPMFRSAAVAHGARVIGVILTGMLDDGTAGMNAIKRCGGTTVVQDPKEAAYPGMPQSVIDNVGVDHCVTLDAMSELLTTLVLKPRTTRARIPADIRSEAEIAERVLSDIGQVEGLGLGDAKLFAASGAWLGWQGLPPVLLIAALGGLGQAMLRAAPQRHRPLAFGPWIAVGFFSLWLWLTWRV